MTDKQLLEQLVKGQAEIKTSLQAQSKVLDDHGQMLNEHSKILNYQSSILSDHGKSLKSIKKKLDKTYKVTNYIALDFDERIVNIDKRTDRIESHLSLPTLKPKQ